MKMKELALTLSVAGALPTLSAITPATLINDNVVLQRDKTVPIWGTVQITPPHQPITDVGFGRICLL